MSLRWNSYYPGSSKVRTRGNSISEPDISVTLWLNISSLTIGSWNRTNWFIIDEISTWSSPPRIFPQRRWSCRPLETLWSLFFEIRRSSIILQQLLYWLWYQDYFWWLSNQCTKKITSRKRSWFGTAKVAKYLPQHHAYWVFSQNNSRLEKLLIANHFSVGRFASSSTRIYVCNFFSM